MTIDRKYSKSSGFYFEARKDFFSENASLLQKAKEANRIYLAQPLRERCKVCAAKLANSGGFDSHGVRYVRCSRCSHLNGRYQDGEAFWSEMYVGEWRDYAQLYLGTKFEDRVRDIYLPKVDFLLEAMPTLEEVPSILDFGCGAGFFVEAALSRGAQATGIDVNASMVRVGNDEIHKRHGSRPLRVVDGSSFTEEMVKSEAKILSAIGVLEHLSDLEEFYSAFASSSFEYLYFSVPMFSLTAVIEHAFSTVAPRHLQGEHTHLFSENSLLRMYERLDVQPVAEWRFGTDFMDLFRSLLLLAGGSGANDLARDLTEKMAPCLDDLQAILDRAHYCSEIHVLAKRK